VLLETLSATESFLLAVLAAGAFAAALWSMRHGVRRAAGDPPTGEVAWSAVAIVILAGVIAAVRIGAGHGL
jgi:hypothetical protein